MSSRAVGITPRRNSGTPRHRRNSSLCTRTHRLPPSTTRVEAIRAEALLRGLQLHPDHLQADHLPLALRQPVAAAPGAVALVQVDPIADSCSR